MRVAFLLLTLVLNGAAQAQSIALQFRARAEMTAFAPSGGPAWLIEETDAFVAPRLSGFAEAFLGERVYALTEMRIDRGEAPADRSLQLRVEQLFLRVTPSTRINFSLQGGKFITPFGNYPGRSHSSADPFIRPPVNYDHRTVISSSHVPRAVAGFLGWQNNDTFRAIGAPIVWAVPYQVGLMAFGGVGFFSYRAALMNSAPSSEPRLWDPWFDESAGPSWVAHGALQISPELRVGASYNRGPYLEPHVQDSVSGVEIDDFDQEIIGLEATLTRGLVELRAELLFDRWEVPNLPNDPRELSYYAEVQYKLLPGLAAAGRFGRIDFNSIDSATGPSEWDHDITRYQVAARYHVTEHFELRAEYMINRSRRNSGLFSLQAVVGPRLTN